MATVRPFCALRPPKERVAEVAAVPYDVVNSEEARALAAGNYWSFLHVSRPEIDLPEGVDLHDDSVYDKGVENLRKLREECPLITESEASLYIYRLRMGDQVQTGVAACCAVDEYDDDRIRKHERTRKDKEDDRTRHTVMLQAQTEPVFLTYRGMDSINELVEREMQSEPLYDFVAPDGVAHTIWRASASSEIEQSFRAVPLLYVADGHHRSASASRARAALREKNPNHTGDEEYNFFLAVVFPAEQLRILPYNRTVKDLNGRSKEEFLASVAERFDVSENASASPDSKGRFSMYLDGKWIGLVPKEPPDASSPISSLDVSILQDRLLAPILGIQDPRTDKKIDFVGGIRGTAELERAVNEKKAAAAFSLYPTTLDDLMNIADANEIMPPKSTWFEPKLRSGMLIHLI